MFSKKFEKLFDGQLYGKKFVENNRECWSTVVNSKSIRANVLRERVKMNFNGITRQDFPKVFSSQPRHRTLFFKVIRHREWRNRDFRDRENKFFSYKTQFSWHSLAHDRGQQTCLHGLYLNRDFSNFYFYLQRVNRKCTAYRRAFHDADSRRGQVQSLAIAIQLSRESPLVETYPWSREWLSAKFEASCLNGFNRFLTLANAAKDYLRCASRFTTGSDRSAISRIYSCRDTERWNV